MSIEDATTPAQHDDSDTPLTPKEAAQLVPCDEKSIYTGMKTGEIPHFKIGVRFYIPRRAFYRLLRGETPPPDADKLASIAAARRARAEDREKAAKAAKVSPRPRGRPRTRKPIGTDDDTPNAAA
jgi:hypothetical protein